MRKRERALLAALHEHQRNTNTIPSVTYEALVAHLAAEVAATHTEEN